jgi:hypothetical protein
MILGAAGAGSDLWLRSGAHLTKLRSLLATRHADGLSRNLQRIEGATDDVRGRASMGI